MLAKERQNKILELIKKQGAVSVASLVSQFNVSVETIRRDLLYMEKAGFLSRVHGGAVPNNAMKPYLTLHERVQEHKNLKRELSITACSFINEGDTIALDQGSTGNVFAEVLRDKFKNLTVITHSLDVLEILRENEGIKIILCAGEYMTAENSFYGPLVLSAYDSINIPKTFIFPSAISLENGICDYQSDLVLVQKQIIKSSASTYFLADSSKFEKKALFKLDDVKLEYNFVTDSSLSSEIKKLYFENNIKIYTEAKND